MNEKSPPNGTLAKAKKCETSTYDSNNNEAAHNDDDDDGEKIAREKSLILIYITAAPFNLVRKIV